MSEGANRGQSETPEEGITERIAAILAADAVGYSRLMADDEKATIAALDRARAVFTEQIQANRGRVVDTAGDSVLAVFETTNGAVRASVSIQKELTALNEAVPEARQMRFRIGIHLGDIHEKADGTVYGDGVNVAARLQAIAEPGVVVASDLIRGAAERRVDVGFAFLGVHEVKNIDEPVKAYQLVPSESGLSLAPQRHKTLTVSHALALSGLLVVAVVSLLVVLMWLDETDDTGSSDVVAQALKRVTGDQADPILASPNGPSIAVLPFYNQSGDPAQDYFSDGITEDIITDISRVDGLFVIARNSSFRYKLTDSDIAVIARELGVRYLLTGGVRRSNDRVRVSAQLVDSTTGGQVWANRFDRNITDVFAVQDDVTREIVSALEVHFDDDQGSAGAVPLKTNIQAYDLFLKARAQKNLVTYESNLTAERLFREAIAVDPGFASAHAELSYVLWRSWFYGWGNPPARLIDARDAAERAVAINAYSALARARLAWVLAWSHELERAVAEAQDSVQLDANFAEGRLALASVLSMAGHHDDAVAEAIKAELLDPYSFLAKFTRGVAHFGATRYDDAIAAHQAALKINPNFPGSHQFLAAIYGLLGREEEARVEAEAVRRLTGVSFLELDLRWPVADFSQKQRLIEGLRKAGFEVPNQPATTD